MTGQRRSRMTDSVCDLWSTEPWPLQLTPDHCKRAQRFTATSQGASSGHGVRPEEGWGGGVCWEEDNELVKAQADFISGFPACLFPC